MGLLLLGELRENLGGDVAELVVAELEFLAAEVGVGGFAIIILIRIHSTADILGLRKVPMPSKRLSMAVIVFISLP